jgi:hypothetical protein
MGCIKRLYILIERHVREVALENPGYPPKKKAQKNKCLMGGK